MTATATPTIVISPKTLGIAGQYGYHVTVDYADESEDTRVWFLGSVYGGPVTIQLPSGFQFRVDPDVQSRCGYLLTEEFIRTFYDVTA